VVHLRATFWLFALALLSPGCGRTAACAEGFAEADGICWPFCAEECGDHQTCKVTKDTAQCECVPGYEGNPCKWGGGLVDSEFTDPDAWSSVNGATVSPLAATLSGEGIASFTRGVTCEASAVSQIVDMPRYEDAEPFVVNMLYRQEGGPGIEVGYGRARRRLIPRQRAWAVSRFCLGEAAYGGPVKFQVAATEPPLDCLTTPESEFSVDSFEIAVAYPGECPEPGSATNGEANIGEEGWHFYKDLRSGSGAGTPEFSLEPDVGESGSSGARLYKPAGVGKRAGVYTHVSVPLPSEANPSPALRFWWKASSVFFVSLGTHPVLLTEFEPFDKLVGDGTGKTHTYCLPPWTHGGVHELTFMEQYARAEDTAELIVDNVEIISDPRCGESEDLFDPSFDSAPNRWPGVGIAVEEGSAVTVVDDPERARPPGPGVLELRYASNQSRLTARTLVWIPKPEENRGPQLVFHSNVPQDPGLGVFWTFGVYPNVIPECTNEDFCQAGWLNQELPQGGGWRRNAVCLPPTWAERWFLVRFAVRPSDDPYETFEPPRTVLLDDFSLGLDEACPAQ